MTIVTLTHEGGDNIDKDNINVTINGEPAWATPDPPKNTTSGKHMITITLLIRGKLRNQIKSPQVIKQLSPSRLTK